MPKPQPQLNNVGGQQSVSVAQWVTGMLRSNQSLTGFGPKPVLAFGGDMAEAASWSGLGLRSPFLTRDEPPLDYHRRGLAFQRSSMACNLEPCDPSAPRHTPCRIYLQCGRDRS
jgi:hypothetical protein